MDSGVGKRLRSWVLALRVSKAFHALALGVSGLVKDDWAGEMAAQTNDQSAAPTFDDEAVPRSTCVVLLHATRTSKTS